MFFDKKFDRAMDLNKNKEKKHEKEKLDLEKKDITAMLISAFIIFIPMALLVLGIMVGVAFLFF